jgi:hypothetical protein
VLALVAPVVVLGVAGLAGGAIWTWWADPPAESEARRANADVELLLARQFPVDGSFAITGLAVGFVVGVALAWALRHTGWLLVVGITLGGLVATTTSYLVGVIWGPGPEAGSERGELLSGALSIHAPGVLLSWPVSALLGAVLVVWLSDRAADRAAEPTLPELPRHV